VVALLKTDAELSPHCSKISNLGVKGVAMQYSTEACVMFVCVCVCGVCVCVCVVYGNR